jgi:hypothetical protein
MSDNTVIINSQGRKQVIFKDRELVEGETFHSDRAHEDGDFSYLCTNSYCRCSS